jgi:predicted ATPase/class 3 adenylate cyclase
MRMPAAIRGSRAMRELPTGSVAFLFTDIEGSTGLFEQHPGAMPAALARHHALLRDAIETHQGQVFQVVGDGVCAVFITAEKALHAALDAQRALHREDWGPIGAIRVRMGLHTGDAQAQGGEYISSLTLVRTQRVSAAGHGGQTLLSSAMAQAVRERLPDGTTLRDLGAFKLRGLADAESISELVVADLPSDFPALKVEDTETLPPGALDELVRGKLIGRSGEVAQLKRHWEQAQQARGHLVLLSGEPGVGKTRLARELIAQAYGAGATILRGGCYEFEATTPYLPFVEAFREWARRQTPAQLRTALGATAPEIAKFAPEIEAKLGPIAPNAPLSPGEERMRLFDNVARFLQSLAAARGLLVFTDDIHWADQGTLSLLRYLLRTMQGDRVLFLAPYREIELDRAHPLAAALVEWNRERLATRIPLGRLSRADTNALLAALFGQDAVEDDFADALFRETEGNPFFIEEVVKSLIEQGQIYREGGNWGRKEVHELTIPQSVKEAIGRRLDRMSEVTTDTLRTAAALGKTFGFSELAAASATGEDALLDALDEASAAQLVRPVEGSDGFAFTHDKIREVLYEEMNPIRRRRLHQRIGEALEGMLDAQSSAGTGRAPREVRMQDLAHHFTQAGDFERSLKYLRRAADNALRIFAHDEALKYLEQAHESAEALQRDADLAAVDEQAGDVHDSHGSIPLAIERYERALSRTHEPAARAALKLKVGTAYVPTGEARGLAMLTEAAAELDPATQANALAHSIALIGRYHHYRADPQKALEYLERALALALPHDDVATLTDIYSYLAGAHQHLIQYEESNRNARLCIALGESRNFPAAIAIGNEFLSENAMGRGYWDEAIAYAQRNRAAGRTIGAMARVAWGGFGLTAALYGKGLLQEARTEALATMQVALQIGENRLMTWLDPSLAMAAADLGDDANAKIHAEQGWQRAKALDQKALTGWALIACWHVALQADDLAGALERHGQYLALVKSTENRVVKLVGLARAAEVSLVAKRIDEAERLAVEALAVAELAGAPHYRAMAQAVQGRIALAQGNHEGAATLLDAALHTYASAGSALEEARARVHRAAVHRAAQESDAARAETGRARETFARLGAAHDLARADAFLAESG